MTLAADSPSLPSEPAVPPVSCWNYVEALLRADGCFATRLTQNQFTDCSPTAQAIIADLTRSLQMMRTRLAVPPQTNVDGLAWQGQLPLTRYPR
jgi:hypothetical protein